MKKKKKDIIIGAKKLEIITNCIIKLKIHFYLYVRISWMIVISLWRIYTQMKDQSVLKLLIFGE